MKKNKGMKIYKQRKKKRGSDSQILSILGTCAVVFGAGIFGYYVIAVPMAKVFRSMNSEPEVMVSDSIAEDSLPVITEAVTTRYKSSLDGLEIEKVGDAEEKPERSAGRNGCFPPDDGAAGLRFVFSVDAECSDRP